MQNELLLSRIADYLGSRDWVAPRIVQINSYTTVVASRRDLPGELHVILPVSSDQSFDVQNAKEVYQDAENQLCQGESPKCSIRLSIAAVDHELQVVLMEANFLDSISWMDQRTHSTKR